MWKWQKMGRIYLAGEIALFTGLAILITSLPWIRRRNFEIFYYTHHLYIVFFVFFLFHAGDRHFYMVLPGVFLFGLDKLLRMIQSRPQTCIVSARVFPCKAIELILPKDPSKSSLLLDRSYTIKSNVAGNSENDVALLFRPELYPCKCDICEDTNYFQVSVALLQHNFKLHC